MEELIFLFIWLLFIKLMQISLLPYLKQDFKRSAVPVSYSLPLLLFLLTSWYAAQFGLSVVCGIIPFLGLAIWAVSNRRISIETLKGSRQYDLIFLTFFLFALGFRYTNPAILTSTEHCMDHAFIASVMQSQVVPPLDPWFAGGRLSMYYYFSHWLFGVLGILTHTPSAIVFNLAVPTVVGLSAVNLYAIGDLFLKRFRWLPLLTFLLIPPGLIWFYLQSHDFYQAMSAEWWVRGGIITEYPLFSIIFGDPHAHLVAVICSSCLLLILLYLLTSWQVLSSRSRVILTAWVAVLLSLLPGLNSWDPLIYGPLTLAAGIYLLIRDYQSKEPLWSGLVFILGTTAGALTLAAPYLLKLQTPGISGWSRAPAWSNPEFIILYAGLFVAIATLLCIPDIRKKPILFLFPAAFLLAGAYSAAMLSIPIIYLLKRVIDGALIAAPAVGGFAVFLFCEFFTLVQSADYNPINYQTVLKFTFIGSILIGTGVMLLLGEWLVSLNLPRLPKRASQIVMILVVVILICSPVVAQIDINTGMLQTGFPGGRYTLDGFAYMDTARPGEREALDYLTSQKGQVRVVEAVGYDYSLTSRVSSYTGFQTILGQSSHEFQWRGNDDGWFYERIEEVKSVYEDPEKAPEVLKKYNITHVFVGDLEEKQYKLDLSYKVLSEVYNQSGVRIYEVGKDKI